LGSIGNGLSVAMQAPNEREAALLTFMVSASGISFFGLGSAFWGLVAGVVTLLIVNAGKRY
ncbi:MAG: benzoate/H(+) symporter BenE family transporter, partial [Pseudomonas sp.]